VVGAQMTVRGRDYVVCAVQLGARNNPMRLSPIKGVSIYVCFLIGLAYIMCVWMCQTDQIRDNCDNCWSLKCLENNEGSMIDCAWNALILTDRGEHAKQCLLIRRWPCARTYQHQF